MRTEKPDYSTGLPLIISHMGSAFERAHVGYISIPNENLDKLSGLSGKTIYVYLLLRKELRYKRGCKNKLVPTEDIMAVSYGDAKKKGVGKNTFGRAMKSLEAVGLVEIAKHGRFGGRRPVEYRIK